MTGPNGYIYLVQCAANLRCYVGQTKNKPEIRLRSHLSAPKSRLLFEDKEKYGLGSLRTKVIQEVPLELLDESEKFWIKALEPAYNITYRKCSFGLQPAWVTGELSSPRAIEYALRYGKHVYWLMGEKVSRPVLEKRLARLGILSWVFYQKRHGEENWDEGFTNAEHRYQQALINLAEDDIAHDYCEEFFGETVSPREHEEELIVAGAQLLRENAYRFIPWMLKHSPALNPIDEDHKPLRAVSTANFDDKNDLAERLVIK